MKSGIVDLGRHRTFRYIGNTQYRREFQHPAKTLHAARRHIPAGGVAVGSAASVCWSRSIGIDASAGTEIVDFSAVGYGQPVHTLYRAAPGTYLRLGRGGWHGESALRQSSD